MKAMEKTDEQLIFETGKGSRAAFRELFSRYSKQMYALTIKMLGSKYGNSHDEVFQEIMLRIWQKASLFDANKGKARSWIYLIATRHIINFTSSKTAKSDLNEQPLEGDETNTDINQPEEIVLKTEKLQIATKLLDRLPDEMRQSIVLRHLENRSIDEISKVANCPVGTVKSRIFNGLKRIKKLISEEKINE